MNLEKIEHPMDMNEFWFEHECGYDFVTEYDSFCGGCGKKLDRTDMTRQDTTENCHGTGCPDYLTCSHDACIEARHRKDTAEIECNYIQCASGMGVAGMRECFLGGDYTDKNCPKFISEDDFIKPYKTENKQPKQQEIEQLQMTDGSISDEELVDTINELVRAVNEIRKEQR